MKAKKMLKKLVDFLDAEEYKKHKHRDELKILLKMLDKKKIKLEDELLKEGNDRKRKRLVKELEIIGVQREKGQQALQDLMES